MRSEIRLIEIRNPNLEIRNKFKARNRKSETKSKCRTVLRAEKKCATTIIGRPSPLYSAVLGGEGTGVRG
jgi:hypothetical protein